MRRIVCCSEPIGTQLKKTSHVFFKKRRRHHLAAAAAVGTVVAHLEVAQLEVARLTVAPLEVAHLKIAQHKAAKDLLQTHQANAVANIQVEGAITAKRAAPDQAIPRAQGSCPLTFWIKTSHPF